MNPIAIFAADGCEEIEALTVVDLLRRADLHIDIISINGTLLVTGSHNIRFEADAVIESLDLSSYDGIILPGGMPGTRHLANNSYVIDALHQFFQAGKLIAAICAAPSILGQEGLLQGITATCYPGYEDKLTGANYSAFPVIKSEHIITSRSMGTAIDFALEIIRYFQDDENAERIRKAIVYQQEDR
ncbi:MAG: DJ-1 family glyoxalase III [Lachnospiraceae bacterium]